ncbi:hypothetical protein J6590_094435, partial [Homalodisca vitripennis]
MEGSIVWDGQPADGRKHSVGWIALRWKEALVWNDSPQMEGSIVWEGPQMEGGISVRQG